MTKSSFLFFFLFFLSIVYSSCGEYEVLEIERQCKKVADSLFRETKDSLIKMSDTLCDSQFDAYYKDSKDSIYKIQFQKINELIEKWEFYFTYHFFYFALVVQISRIRKS